jgi:8-hydroxy-5-deazaflavin:NADPH oxidoreductase
MRIGIIGAGLIGKTLARKFSAGGHDVLVANSRGPETIEPDALEFGARAATASDAIEGADVVIISVPFGRIPKVANSIANDVPRGAVVIDTSNYYPHLGGVIDAIERGQVESLWVAEQLGRPIVKAWNAVRASTLQERGVPAGTPGRIALPVAADSDAERRVGMDLVDESGFDPFDAGTLAESWRQQPGQPAYFTQAGMEEMGPALAAADLTGAPKKRDLYLERLAALGPSPSSDDMVRLIRTLVR